MSNEYRCTRPDMYTNVNCPGYKDVSARCGHYIEAESAQEALNKMQDRYPKDSCFDIQLWGTRG